jgi:hypothetical protein
MTEVANALKSTDKDKEACSFVPTRKNQSACKNPIIVSFGDRHYCKDHKRTVQAKKEQEKWAKEEEEKLKQKMEEQDSESSDEEEEDKTDEDEEEEQEQKETIEKFRNLSTTKSENVTKKKIYKNKYGRFEDPDTHFVFDPKDKLVYGVQDNVTGKVRSLTERDIQKCINRKWRYLEVTSTNDEDEEEEDQSTESDDTSSDDDD